MNKILKDYSESEIKSAQEKLDKLCEEYNVKKFTLGKGKPFWQELCMNMIGLNKKIKVGGRPKVRTEEEELEIASYLTLLTAFEALDGEKIGKSMRVKEATHKTIEKYGLKAEIYGRARTTDPANVIRGILYRQYPELLQASYDSIRHDFDDPIDFPQDKNKKESQN